MLYFYRAKERYFIDEPNQGSMGYSQIEGSEDLKVDTFYTKYPEQLGIKDGNCQIFTRKVYNDFDIIYVILEDGSVKIFSSSESSQNVIEEDIADDIEKALSLTSGWC